jgi:hypothetical protein
VKCHKKYTKRCILFLTVIVGKKKILVNIVASIERENRTGVLFPMHLAPPVIRGQMWICSTDLVTLVVATKQYMSAGAQFSGEIARMQSNIDFEPSVNSPTGLGEADDDAFYGASTQNNDDAEKSAGKANASPADEYS